MGAHQTDGALADFLADMMLMETAPVGEGQHRHPLPFPNPIRISQHKGPSVVREKPSGSNNSCSYDTDQLPSERTGWRSAFARPLADTELTRLASP